MSGHSTRNIVKGRKQHVCVLCGLRIRKGARHHVASGHWDGRAFRERFHEVCLAATSDWDAGDWECRSGTEDDFCISLGLPLIPNK